MTKEEIELFNKFLAKAGCKNRFYTAFKDCGDLEDLVHYNSSDVINGGMFWVYTAEGWNFWNALNTRHLDFLKDKDLSKVKRLRFKGRDHEYR